ncbi:FAD-binding oxidoreductase [Massilia sp. H-1]|nr:FAD-binding oxidoreductase [Massilia sp. H-1]
MACHRHRTRLPAPQRRRARRCVRDRRLSIAGLTTAYMLLRSKQIRGRDRRVGVGAHETGRTTAHFFPPDERFFEIERGFGTDKGLVADSYRQATDCVEAIIRSERIECEFERLDGYLFSPEHRWDDTLEHEYAVTTRLGLNVRRLERVPGLSFDTGPCLRFANQAQFHPLKYLAGLAAAITRMGGRIYGQTRGLDIHGDSKTAHVRTGNGQCARGRGRGRHQHAVQRPGGDAHQAVRLPHLCGRHACRKTRCRACCCGTRAIPTTTSGWPRPCPGSATNY